MLTRKIFWHQSASPMTYLLLGSASASLPSGQQPTTPTKAPGRDGGTRYARLVCLFVATALLGARPSPAHAATVAEAAQCTPLQGASEPGSKLRADKRKVQELLAQSRKNYLAGEFALALADLRTAYALDPQVEVLYNIAQVCRESGHERQALAMYEDLLKGELSAEMRAANQQQISALRSKLADANAAVGQTALDTKEYVQAIEAWKSAHAYNPRPAFLFKLAEAQRLAGQPQEALTTYERFLESSPNEQTLQARKWLPALRAQLEDRKASAQYERKEYGAAAATWDRAYQQDSQPQYLFHHAEALHAAGSAEAADQAYQRFLKECPPTESTELRQQAESRRRELATERARQAAAAAERARVPLYKKWWLWTAVGAVVVVGVAVGVGVGVSISQQQSIPGDRPRFEF